MTVRWRTSSLVTKLSPLTHSLTLTQRSDALPHQFNSRILNTAVLCIVLSVLVLTAFSTTNTITGVCIAPENFQTPHDSTFSIQCFRPNTCTTLLNILITDNMPWTETPFLPLLGLLCLRPILFLYLLKFPNVDVWLCLQPKHALS